MVVMSNFADQNDNHKYILNVIDTFSKYAWLRPLKKKNGIEVSRAFEDIIKHAIRIGHKSPNLLHTDRGIEFKNKEFNSVVKKCNIRLYHTNEEKSSVIERYNRTKNNRMKVILEINKYFIWKDMFLKLSKIIIF